MDLIRENLSRFGLIDLKVIGLVKIEGNRPGGDEFVEMPAHSLVKLAVNRNEFLPFEKLLKGETFSSTLDLLAEGGMRIKLTSDNIVMCVGAPDLRTALAWILATDGGREKPLLGIDIDAAVKKLEQVIQEGGRPLVEFKQALKEIFIYKETTRFADAYVGALPTLWKVGTRAVLGHELSIPVFFS